MGTKDTDRTQAERARAGIVRRFGKVAGFLGAGLAERAGRLEILVLLATGDSPARDKLPRTAGGFPVSVQVVGQPQKHDDD